jgi:phosphonoacetaldehyde hydrolase
MDFVFQRTYRGKVQAAILDWAGTTVDYGCFAPVAAFMRAFEQQGVPITVSQARAPMGMGKRDHIRAITRMELVAEQWQEKFGRACAEADVETLHHEFETQLLDSIVEYSDVIPGTTETIAQFRARGMKIGSTTGYTRALMTPVTYEAQARGYTPDAVVCVDEVPAGRPAPWMALQCMVDLKIYPAEAIVKIGDTVPDIEEGLNAGMWTIAIVETGNEMGLREAELDTLETSAYKARREQVYRRLALAAPHYVVDSIADCDAVIDDINARLARGERP